MQIKQLINISEKLIKLFKDANNFILIQFFSFKNWKVQISWRDEEMSSRIKGEASYVLIALNTHKHKDKKVKYIIHLKKSCLTKIKPASSVLRDETFGTKLVVSCLVWNDNDHSVNRGEEAECAWEVKVYLKKMGSVISHPG